MTIDYGTPPEEFLNLGHSEVAYRKIGSGPDVLFIHGWPLHAGTFRDIAAQLQSDYTCHLIDLPGAGFSKVHDTSRISIEHHIETVHQVVEQLGLSRYALVAHDSGAIIARHIAARDGCRVAGLVMGNTEIPNYESPMLKLLMGMGRFRWGRALIGASLASRWIRRSPLFFGACFSNVDLVDGEFHRLFIEPTLQSRKRAWQQMRLIETFDARLVHECGPLHGQLEAPVLLVWGENDPYFPLTKAKEMLPDFREASLQVIKGGKLFAHEEYPVEFAQATREFLQRCFEQPREVPAAATA